MNLFDNLPSEFIVSLPKDEKGLLGRACPNADCLGFFKVEPGTGLQGDNLLCYCPYCGHEADPSQFNTKDQLEYARSAALKTFQDALHADLKKWGRDIERNSRGGFLQLKVDVKGTPRQLYYYAEEDLETELVCTNCTLHYAIFGVFGYCPDCRIHNTQQILDKNLDLVLKQLDKADEESDPEFALLLVHNALEDSVSAFDAFGREAMRVHDPAEKISFQDIGRARNRLLSLYGLDLTTSLSSSEWDAVERSFQKRHLLAHSMGVVDARYVAKTGDHSVAVGRKVVIEPDEVRELVSLLRTIGAILDAGLSSIGNP